MKQTTPFPSEIGTLHEDGYLSGERIRIRDARHPFFDEVGFTKAFLGDIATPSFFDRGTGLKESNYRQVFAIAPGVTASGFYTHEMGSEQVLTLIQQGLNAGDAFDPKAMVNNEKLIF